MTGSLIQETVGDSEALIFDPVDVLISAAISWKCTILGDPLLLAGYIVHAMGIEIRKADRSPSDAPFHKAQGDRVFIYHFPWHQIGKVKSGRARNSTVCGCTTATHDSVE